MNPRSSSRRAWPRTTASVARRASSKARYWSEISSTAVPHSRGPHLAREYTDERCAHIALGWIENAREHQASVGTWPSSRCAYRVHRSKAETLGQYGASRSHGDGIDALSCMIALTERHDRVRPYAEEQLTLAHRATNFGDRTSARSARWPDPMWHRLVSPPKSMSSWRPSTMHAPVLSAVITASLMISASSDLDVGVNAHHALRGEIKSPRMTIRSSPVSANVGLLALRPSRKRAIPARSSCRLNIARSPRHCPTIVRSII
jgi:hypothetical protein